MPVLTKNEIVEMFPQLNAWLADLLMSISGVNKTNTLYDSIEAEGGADFADEFFGKLGVNITVSGDEKLSKLGDGAFITIANHPYGSLDGLALIKTIARVRPDYKIMVNKMLMHFKKLQDNFISVIPTGATRTSPTIESLTGVKNSLLHLKEGHPLGLFPSGAVSDLSIKEGFRVRDREWQIPAIRLIQKARVSILPVRFFDGNSWFYYTLGLIDWRVRLLDLPNQIFNRAGKPFRMKFGDIISPEQQDMYKTPEAFRDFLRGAVYGMEL